MVDGRRFFCLLPPLLALLIIFSGPCFAETGTTLRIGGTGGALELIRKLAALYTSGRDGRRFTIVPSLGSKGGIRALRDGVLDIAVSARPAGPEEKGTRSVLLGVTPLVFVVHPGVPVKNISTDELERIYSGSLTTWPDGSRIRLILRPGTESDTKALRGISPSMDKVVTAALSRPGMPMAFTDGDNLTLLQKTRGSLGMAALATLAAERARLKTLSFNGIRPDSSPYTASRYPLFRRFYLIVRDPASAAVRDFERFTALPVARALLENNQCKFWTVE